VDFIDFYVNNWHWPAFNIADSAITLGIVLLLATGFREELHKKPSPD
ncbi:MAG: signal peptidase II, partial [Chromatiaceae bacterium]